MVAPGSRRVPTLQSLVDIEVVYEVDVFGALA